MSDDEFFKGREYDQISTHCSIGRHYGRCQDESGLHMLQAGHVCMCHCHDSTELADAGCYEDSSFIDGVCVAFGLMGMAEAIRARQETPRLHAREYQANLVAQQEGLARSAQQQQQNYNIGQAMQYQQRGPTIDEVIARDAWLQRERKK